MIPHQVLHFIQSWTKAGFLFLAGDQSWKEYKYYTQVKSAIASDAFD